ncbi:patatin-like phospholipase family protein [Bradyrhizobium betae]|uniref:patatin-like phospholipase family protein n=1 Tax=Bradyrhizobium betae TaxID=244734 RepID=UPI003D67EE3F
MGIVIAFSGPIGAGKSTISQKVAELLHWPRVSFGEYVQKVAAEYGEDRDDRTVLQRLGQALVLADVDGFVDGVLREKQWRNAAGEGNLVVDGLRHAEVRHALVQNIKPNTLKHVFVTVDEDTRQQRVFKEDNIEPRLLMRYDQDITEAQIPRIIREYKDIEVSGKLPAPVAAKEIVARLGLQLPYGSRRIVLAHPMKAFGVFEGGGAKGYAHVGALHAIEARGIKLEAVAGSSIGAVIALLVASGFSARELFHSADEGKSGLLSASWIDHLNQTDWAAFKLFHDEYFRGPGQAAPVNLSFLGMCKVALSLFSAARRHNHLFSQIWTRYGLTDSAGFREWLEAAVREKLGVESGPVLFRHMKLPLKVVAGDLLSGKMRVFGGMRDADLNAIDAAVASASYPLFFQPYKFEGSLFVDGGLVSNLPAWVFDEERSTQSKPTPTFGFRFVEVPLVGRVQPTATLPTSFPQFFKHLATTAVFGGQELGARGIDDYYAFRLAADIDTLAFDEIEAKAPTLIEAGRKGVSEFFDSQLGPSDPDFIEMLLGIVANFIVQALDRRAKEKLSHLRSFVLIRPSPNIIKVAYAANATEDADDRLRIRSDAPGMAQCFSVKEPVLTIVPDVPHAIRVNPALKYEHAARPRDVITNYAIPIFADPENWLRSRPDLRDEPIAVLVIDSSNELAYLLQQPEFEDRLATYAQICGEYLRGGTVTSEYAMVSSRELLPSELIELGQPGFYVSDRKVRVLFQDDETGELVKRIAERTRSGPSQD